MRIPDPSTWIPDSILVDSGFHTRGFRIPYTWIPDSKLNFCWIPDSFTQGDTAETFLKGKVF